MKLNPLLPYLLIAAGLFSTLALFLTLKREIRRHAQRSKLRIEAMLARLNEAETTREPAPATVFVPAPLRAGLNLNKRVHAMRMLRRGEDVGHIAAALGVPRPEVELMIRVQAIGKARAAGSDQG
jgi:type III secretory pathway component EscV